MKAKFTASQNRNPCRNNKNTRIPRSQEKYIEISDSSKMNETTDLDNDDLVISDTSVFSFGNEEDEKERGALDDSIFQELHSYLEGKSYSPRTEKNHSINDQKSVIPKKPTDYKTTRTRQTTSSSRMQERESSPSQNEFK